MWEDDGTKGKRDVLREARVPDAMEDELKKNFRPDKLRPMGTDEMTPALTHMVNRDIKVLRSALGRKRKGLEGLVTNDDGKCI
jgi:hypothetical protein